MVTSGIDRIHISVKDMDESLAFFRDCTGMKVVADQHLDTNAMQRLWNLPAGTEARAVYLKNREQTTLLQLIEFNPRSEIMIRDGAQTWDFGLFDIAWFVKNLDKTYQYLLEKEYTFHTPPTAYKATWSGRDVNEAILIGPNAMPIALIEKPDIEADYQRIADQAQIVEDMNKTITFYRDILGLKLLGDMELPKGLIDDVLALPAGTDVWIAFFNQEDSSAPVVEAVELSIKGKAMASVARPPHLGLFMISFETDNLSELMKNFKQKDISTISGPVEFNIKPHGTISAITVEGPNKELIEIFEK